VRAEIAGGADFATVAQRESADSASAVNGGLLTIRKDQTFPAFDQAAFSQPINQLGQPILAQSGYHIIRVERRWASDSASVRHILIPVDLTREHEDDLLDKADSMDVLTETLKVDRIAQEIGIEVQETELIPGLGFVPGMGEAADGTDWAFRTANPGDVSTVYETPSAYYVFELISKEEDRTLTRQEATETIRAGLMVRKKIEATKERAREAVDRIQGGQSFEAVAAALNLEVQSPPAFTRADFVPGLGRMNAAIGTAFGLRPGQTSGVVEANQSVYIIHLVSRKDADRAAWEQQRETQRQQVIQALAQQRWESYLAALREDARIIDNREAILRPAVPVTPLGT
jgi:parvulin-like peptidyl-prolyl isomerase